MRKLKKLMALALTLAFALTMGTVSTFAASVEINTDSTDTHVYKVYQIFTGDLSGTTLSNLKYVRTMVRQELPFRKQSRKQLLMLLLSQRTL